MDKARRGEIACALIKAAVKERKISFDSLRRDIGNWAGVIGIEAAKLGEFFGILLTEILVENRWAGEECLEAVEMDDMTKGRIAYALVKNRYREEGTSTFSPNTIQREIGRIAEATEVPEDELYEFFTIILKELISELPSEFIAAFLTDIEEFLVKLRFR